MEPSPASLRTPRLHYLPPKLRRWRPISQPAPRRLWCTTIQPNARQRQCTEHTITPATAHFALSRNRATPRGLQAIQRQDQGGTLDGGAEAARRDAPEGLPARMSSTTTAPSTGAPRAASGNARSICSRRCGGAAWCPMRSRTAASSTRAPRVTSRSARSICSRRCGGAAWCPTRSRTAASSTRAPRATSGNARNLLNLLVINA